MWYYSNKNQQKGPVSWDELRGLASDGQLRNSDMVWQEGTPDWVRASEVRGLLNGQAGAATDVRGDEPAPRRRAARDDLDVERRPARRSGRQAQGSSKGLVIGLIVGGVTLVIIAIVVVIIIVANSGSRNKGPVAIAPPPAFPPPVFPPPVIPPGGGPFPVGGGGGRVVLNQTETLSNVDPRDTMLKNSFCKTFNVRMEAGKTYTIDHIDLGANIDPILRLLDARGLQLAFDDDSGGGLNSRIVFRPPVGDTYRIVCTSLRAGATGRFSVTVREN